MIHTILSPKLLAVLVCLKSFRRAMHLREIAKFSNLSPRGASLILKKLCDLKLVNTYEQGGKGSNRRVFFNISVDLDNDLFLSEIIQSVESETLKNRSNSYSVAGTLDWIDETLQELTKARRP